MKNNEPIVEPTFHINAKTRIAIENDVHNTAKPDDPVKTFDEFIYKILGMNVVLDEEVPDDYVRFYDTGRYTFFEEMPFTKVMHIYLDSQRIKDKLRKKLEQNGVMILDKFEE